MSTDPLKLAMNRAYAFTEEQQRALDEGRISEEEWFRRHNAHFTAAYLAGDNPRAQSGHGGDEAAYRYARMMILEAIHRDGRLLDVGCANGYLMEALHRWLQGSGLRVAFDGVEISPELVALAQARLPHWRDHFTVANALFWAPAQPYEYVYLIGPELVPVGRQQAFLQHLLEDDVTPGGRLIVGPLTEERATPGFEERVRAWGWAPTGYCIKAHQTMSALERRLFWFDKSS